MCGIAGIMMRGGVKPPADALERLRAGLNLRGPDSSGVHIQDATGLVETRLAIVDVENGQQPMFGPAGAVLVANGEIYNAPELRAEMGGDAGFKSLSDCEPIVHLFERLGDDYARALRGMYGVALYDPARQTLTISRDQFGIKPLYYVQTPSYLAFASEAAALFQAGLAIPAVRAGAAQELLQLKHVTGMETIFEGVMRVAPGETLVVVDGAVASRRTIPTLAPITPRPMSLETALKAFDKVMTDSVEVHLRTDVPYGLFFSGGIDSSILLTLMQRLVGPRVRALTLGYSGQLPGDESGSALEIAQGSGAQCRRIEMTPDDFWRLAPRIAAALDDPTTDAAILPTFMLGQAARAEGLKVTLCGEGADELFGGYARYRRARLPWAGFLGAGLELGKDERRGALDDAPELVGLFPGWSAGFAAVAAEQRARWKTQVRTLQAIDCCERLPNSLLMKLDRCLMANSVEGRTPFLDREVAAFALGLPDSLKASLKYGKVLLREWLARANPAARPFARKKGFNPPVGAWMAARADTLGELVAAQPGVAALIPAAAVRNVFKEAARQHQPAWSLLFYALWHNHHILGACCDGDVGEALAPRLGGSAPLAIGIGAVSV
jgi:asparagine synthase (glutamine-hydrolysing)